MRTLSLMTFAALVALACLLVPREAAAYPWMIRHGFTTCNQCHTDPSGGGLLTRYGRDEGDTEMRTRYGDGDEVSKLSGFLWGAFEPPSWLTLGGNARGLLLRVDPGEIRGVNPDPTTKFLHMQSDLQAQVTVKGFVANASIGFMRSGAPPAQITRFDENNIVSREHWAGYQWGDGKYLARAGRINLPFGLRDVLHTLWVRKATRSDINDSQQHGVAFAYTGDKLRGEIMGIAGNFQVRPDAFRDRGYSGFLEYAIVPEATLGVSSLTTHAKRDLLYNTQGTRTAHGLFSRVTPFDKLVLLAEVDGVFFLPSKGDTRKGYAGYLQADLEPVQGLHFFLTGEAMNLGGQDAGNSFGGWLSALWFFAPHFDVRLDAIQQNVPAGPDRLNVLSLLAQLHAYL